LAFSIWWHYAIQTTYIGYGILDNRCTFMGTVLNRFPILSDNLSIIRFFGKLPFSCVVTKSRYSLCCCFLG